MSRRKRTSTKEILMACQMSFEGLGNREIGQIIGVTEATVSNWRKLEIWQDFETELIDAYKQQVLTSDLATPS